MASHRSAGGERESRESLGAALFGETGRNCRLKLYRNILDLTFLFCIVMTARDNSRVMCPYAVLMLVWSLSLPSTHNTDM